MKFIKVVAPALFLALPVFSQSPSAWGPSVGAPDPLAAVPAAESAPAPTEAVITPAARMIAEFQGSDVKFDVQELVDILRDRRHEGWVLAAYPDPRTGQPLIGAGFSLDLPEREHPQTDPLNAHPFLEPSSADLWQAAGFDPARLDDILKVFYARKQQWRKRTWRRQLYSLPAQISDDEATELVRVGAIQAIYNAQAYCRYFDRLTGPQQMAMAQLVYQMGVNLEHFSDFLAMINSGAISTAAIPEPQAPTESQAPMTVAMTPVADADAKPELDAKPAVDDQTPEYWQSVQKSLMGSQWAHKYRTRAIAVIAMLDPAYGDDPSAAEQRVSAVLRPAVAHRRHTHAAAATHQAAAGTHRRRAGKSPARAHKRKRA